MTTALIRLIELPGVAEIEMGLRDPGKHLVKEYDDLNERIDELSRELFGIAEDDTLFEYRPDELEGTVYDAARTIKPHGLERRAQWDAHFKFLEDEWEEEDAYWALAGLDVRDDDGERLLIMNHFGRQIVCAMKGLHAGSRLPTQQTGAPTTEEAIEREAERWGRSLLSKNDTRRK
jgi:hypothetical protein